MEDEAQKEEQRIRLTSTVKKAQVFEELASYQGFQDWKRDVIEARLQAFVEVAKTASLDTPEGQQRALNALRSYQQLKYVTDDIFKEWQFAGQQAKERLG